MNDYIITTSGIGRSFKTQDEDFWALKNISIEVPQGKLTILRGRSGSGKTTLMNILGALDYPTEGTVMLEGKDITAMSENERTMLRRTDIGFVFQSVALIPMMTALENVEFALRLTKYEGDKRERAMECLHLVGLRERMAHMPQDGPSAGGAFRRRAAACGHRPGHRPQTGGAFR